MALEDKAATKIQAAFRAYVVNSQCCIKIKENRCCFMISFLIRLYFLKVNFSADVFSLKINIFLGHNPITEEHTQAIDICSFFIYIFSVGVSQLKFVVCRHLINQKKIKKM